MMNFRIFTHIPFQLAVDAQSVVNHMCSAGVLLKGCAAMTQVKYLKPFEATFILVRTKDCIGIISSLYPGVRLAKVKSNHKYEHLHELRDVGITKFIGTEKAFLRFHHAFPNMPIRLYVLDTPSDAFMCAAREHDGYFCYNYIPNIPASERTRDSIIMMHRHDVTLPSLISFHVQPVLRSVNFGIPL